MIDFYIAKPLRECTRAEEVEKEDLRDYDNEKTPKIGCNYARRKR
jgi:hypothetical protein